MPIQQHLISETTPAAASTVASTIVVYGLGEYDAIAVNANLVGATGGTLDVYLQTWDGSDWYDYCHFAQLASGAAAVKYRAQFARQWQPQTNGTVVGKNASPAMPVNTFPGGEWGDRIRAVYVAGASTSAGAAISISIQGMRRRST